MKQTLSFLDSGSQTIYVDSVPEQILFRATGALTVEIRTDSDVIVQSGTPIYKDQFPFLMPASLSTDATNLVGFKLGTGKDVSQKLAITVTNVAGAKDVDICWSSRRYGKCIYRYERTSLVSGADLEKKSFFYLAIPDNTEIQVTHNLKDGFLTETTTGSIDTQARAIFGVALGQSDLVPSVAGFAIVDNLDGSYASARLLNNSANTYSIYAVRATL